MINNGFFNFSALVLNSWLVNVFYKRNLWHIFLFTISQGKFFCCKNRIDGFRLVKYKRSGTDLLLTLIVFLLTFWISFLNTVFSLSVIYFANFPTAIGVDFTPSFSVSVNNFAQSMTFSFMSFLSSASINTFSQNTTSNMTYSVY